MRVLVAIVCLTTLTPLAAQAQQPAAAAPLSRIADRLQREGLLRSTGGNKTRAAELLGLDRKTLYRKLEEYRLES